MVTHDLYVVKDAAKKVYIFKVFISTKETVILEIAVISWPLDFKEANNMLIVYCS